MNNTAKTKQVIILRKDIKMDAGKLAAQSAHASLGVLLNKNKSSERNKVLIDLSNEEIEWFNDRFTKIVLEVNSEKELLDLYDEAKKRKLNTVKIIDKGYTQFNLKETLTAISIGPNYNEKIDEITKDLKLLKESKSENLLRKLLQKIYKKNKKKEFDFIQEIKSTLWGKND